jgi:hypothetical protein
MYGGGGGGGGDKNNMNNSTGTSGVIQIKHLTQLLAIWRHSKQIVPHIKAQPGPPSAHAKLSSEWSISEVGIEDSQDPPQTYLSQAQLSTPCKAEDETLATVFPSPSPGPSLVKKKKERKGKTGFPLLLNAWGSERAFETKVTYTK